MISYPLIIMLMNLILESALDIHMQVILLFVLFGVASREYSLLYWLIHRSKK